MNDEKYRIYKELCSAAAVASGTGGGDPMGAHLRYSATTVGGEMSVEWTGFSFSAESVGLGGGHRVRMGDTVVPESCIEVVLNQRRFSITSQRGVTVINHYAESALKAPALNLISESALDMIHPKCRQFCKSNVKKHVECTRTD